MNLAVDYGGSRGVIQIAIDLSSSAIIISPVGSQISRYAVISPSDRLRGLGDGLRRSIFSRSVYILRGLVLERVTIACL